VLDILLGMSQHKIEVRVDPARLRPVESPVIVCDTSKIHASTGWTADIPIEQTLADVLNDCRVRAGLQVV
jgi:GDP-4-dehydro-6-deoxy-D-mannose reductase